MNPSKKYEPISCAFYDELELLALRGRSVPIRYVTESEQESTIEAIIETFETVQSEEFMVLDNGQRIRLDRLIEVNHIPLSNYSC